MPRTFVPSQICGGNLTLKNLPIIYKPYLIRFSIPTTPKATPMDKLLAPHTPEAAAHYHLTYVIFIAFSWLLFIVIQRKHLHLAYRPTVCRWVSDRWVRILSCLWAIPRGTWLIPLTPDAWRAWEHSVRPIISIDIRINNNVISGGDILTTQFITLSQAVVHHCKQVAIAESVQILDSSTHCFWHDIRSYRSAISLRSQFAMFWTPTKMRTFSSPFIILTFLRQITKVRNAIWRVLSQPANPFFLWLPRFFSLLASLSLLCPNCPNIMYYNHLVKAIHKYLSRWIHVILNGNKISC